MLLIGPQFLPVLILPELLFLTQKALLFQWCQLLGLGNYQDIKKILLTPRQVTNCSFELLFHPQGKLSFNTFYVC